MDDLFIYNPNPDAEINRKIEKARDLLNAGRGMPHFTEIPVEITGWDKLYMHITSYCPFHCPFCYSNSGARKTTDLPAETICDIIKQVIDFGFAHIVVTGGEPLCYDEWDGLIEMLSGIDHKRTELVLRTTMGFPLSDEKLSKACDIFDRIVVSIDGNEETHDANRGAGVYKHAIDNLRKSISIGTCKMEVNAVMTEDEFNGNLGREYRALCEDLGITDYAVHAPKPLGRIAGQFESERGFTWKKKNVGRLPDPHLKFSCGIGSYLYMKPDGSVYPCYAWCGDEKLLGNLSEKSIKEVVENPKLVTLRQSGVDTNRKCRSCDVRYLCGGLCKSNVRNKENFDSGDFDCEGRRERILGILKQYGIE